MIYLSLLIDLPLTRFRLLEESKNGKQAIREVSREQWLCLLLTLFDSSLQWHLVLRACFWLRECLD